MEHGSGKGCAKEEECIALCCILFNKAFKSKSRDATDPDRTQIYRCTVHQIDRSSVRDTASLSHHCSDALHRLSARLSATTHLSKDIRDIRDYVQRPFHGGKACEAALLCF